MELAEWVYLAVGIVAIVAATVGEILGRRRDPEVIETNKRIDSFYDALTETNQKLSEVAQSVPEAVDLTAVLVSIGRLETKAKSIDKRLQKVEDA